jgi:SAM-dependent methyltransferase
MTDTRSDAYLNPYRQAQERLGADLGVTLWANQRSQQRRFAVIARMAMLQGRRILDAGCSRGDFAAYLNDSDIAYAHYVGIDGLDRVIQFAQERKLPNAEFHFGDFVQTPGLLSLGDPQVICLSGTLNTMQDYVVMHVLENAWEATSETLVFNFLSDRCAAAAPQQPGPARRLNTLNLIDWAFKKTWAVQFRHDYFKDGHDATILMRKP